VQILADQSEKSPITRLFFDVKICYFDSGPAQSPLRSIQWISQKSMKSRSGTSTTTLLHWAILTICFELVSISSSSQFHFQNYNTNDGLAGNEVYCIFQDSRDFIWFGTMRGLSRFDGYEFRNYTKIDGDSTSISDNFVTNITEDSSGYLWIGTSNGLSRYDPVANSFKRYFVTTEENAKPLAVNSVIEDKFTGSTLLLATSQGLIRFNHATGKKKVYSFDARKNSINQTTALSLFQDSTFLWIGLAGYGLDRFDLKANEFTHFQFECDDPTFNFRINVIRKITKDTSGNLLLSTYGGLVRFDPRSGAYAVFHKQNNRFPSNTIWEMAPQNDAESASSISGTIPDEKLSEHLKDLADGSLSGDKVGSGINATNITTGTLSSARIPDGAITSTKVADGSLTNLDIHPSAAISGLKINPTFGSQNIFTSGTITGASFNGIVRIPSGPIYLGHNAGATSSTAENIGIGVLALNKSSSGQNIGIGGESLFSNTFGGSNIAIGFDALRANISGNSNIAIGNSALLQSSVAHQNVALGNLSLNRSTGSFNTAVGANALNNNLTGSQNTAVGHNAGQSVQTGTNVTLLGASAQPSSGAVSNQITLGNSSVTSLRCNVQTITSLSDARDKKNIQDLSLGIDFIKQIRPRQFHWDRRDWYDSNSADGSKMQATPTAGFIAQELDDAQRKANAEWLNLVLKDNPEKWEATYGNLLPVLVKAVQEQQEQIEELKTLVQQLLADKQSSKGEYGR
jgi:hypothetical protein